MYSTIFSCYLFLAVHTMIDLLMTLHSSGLITIIDLNKHHLLFIYIYIYINV